MNLLKVPFNQKDEAKALGAKWNQAAKSWFAPEGSDLDTFAKWLPIQSSLDFDSDRPDKGVTLSSLLNEVGFQIRSKFSSSYWVKAEIANISNKHHAYLDLVEYDESKTKVAHVKAAIWSSNVDKIFNKFYKNTTEELAPGISILIKATIDFHPQYGLSLIVEDIDPSYTVGAMQAKINEILSQLKTDQVIDNNRLLNKPLDFTKVAVISPEGAAGLGDFRAEADLLDATGLCSFSYFPALFQGNKSRISIVNAFKRVAEDYNNNKFDAIVFIRGGGAKSDLHYVNEYDIAKSITDSPIPVFVGIGHQQDSGVADVVSHQTFDTPSKVINHIFTTIVENALEADRNFTIIKSSLSTSLNISEQLVLSLYNEVKNNAVSATLQAQNNLDIYRTRIHNNCDMIVIGAENILLEHFHAARYASTLSIQAQELNLKSMMKSVIQNNPINIIDRGFAIIKTAASIITKTSDLPPSTDIIIQLKDGNVSATTN